jgi:alcohol dehydrogenase class IV
LHDQGPRALKAAGLGAAVFSDIKGNPIGKNVDDGLAAYRAGKHDGVIAFGGGSALDAGKAVALMTGQKRPIWDFEDVGDNWARVDPAGVAPIIAVPTTAGTGSEVGRVSVITNEETHQKKLIFHPKVQPSIVISDPALTVGLPPKITAATGMDALAHCFEAYCTPFYHPMAEGVAVEGMRLIKEWLPIAVKDGKNLTARAQMLCAATMGATAFQKGLGAIHSLSHPLGAVYDTHQASQRRRHALCHAVQPQGHRREDAAPRRLARLSSTATRPCSIGCGAAPGSASPHAEGPRRRHRQARRAQPGRLRRSLHRRQPRPRRRGGDEADVRREY